MGAAAAGTSGGGDGGHAMPWSCMVIARLSASEVGSSVCCVNSHVAEWEAGPTRGSFFGGDILTRGRRIWQGGERSGTRGSDEIVGVFWECGQVNEEWNDE